VVSDVVRMARVYAHHFAAPDRAGVGIEALRRLAVGTTALALILAPLLARL